MLFSSFNKVCNVQQIIMSDWVETYLFPFFLLLVIFLSLSPFNITLVSFILLYLFSSSMLVGAIMEE